jgi:hypothetical protein
MRTGGTEGDMSGSLPACRSFNRLSKYVEVRHHDAGLGYFTLTTLTQGVADRFIRRQRR